MKNKGFTLVELLAVIAILAIIIGICFAVYIGVQRNILNSQLKNTVSYIEVQAQNYANDTNITVVSVEDLILNGYVEPDDETDIYNPVDKTSLNCYLVRSTYEDGEFNASLVLENENLLDRNKNGTCNNYEKESVISIGVDEEGTGNYSSEIKDWYKDDVTLAVLGENKTIFKKDGATYEWRSNYGGITTKDTVTTEVSEGIVSSMPYSVSVRYNENGKNINAEAQATINIDKEAPRIIAINIPNPTQWATSRGVDITATDGNGSGLKGIYVGLDLTECTEDLDYIEIEDETKITQEVRKEGTYRACAIDNVGNVSQISEAFEIINVDGGISHIELNGDPTNTNQDGNQNWTNEVTLIGITYDDQSGIASYGFANSNNKDETLTNKVNNVTTELKEEKEVTQNGTYYFCAKDSLNNHECADYKVENIDTIKPTGKLTINKSKSDYISGQSKYAFSFVLDVSVNDVADTKTGDTASKTSGLNGYQITTSSTTPSNWIEINTEGTEKYTTTYTANDNATYYLWVKDKAGNIGYTTLKVSDVVERSTKSKIVSDLYSETSSTIRSSETISDIVYLSNVSLISGGGTVSSKSLSNKTVSFTVTGGTTQSSRRLEPFTERADSYGAYEDRYCSYYSCDAGGVASGSTCVANRGNRYTINGYGMWTCNPGGGGWLEGDSTYTACDEGYSETYTCDPVPSTVPCTPGEQRRRNCTKTCTWQGNYGADCDREGVEYSCDRGDRLNGSTCYTCSRGTLISTSVCEYEDWVDYNYWQYSVRIDYYYLKR